MSIFLQSEWCPFLGGLEAATDAGDEGKAAWFYHLYSQPGSFLMNARPPGEEEIRGEIDHPRVVPEPTERMVVGIDGAFVKAWHTRAGQRHQFEILTGRVEASQRGGVAFAVVRDLDPYTKRRVQAILRRCGRGQDTDLRILSDGEDGLRWVVGTWFGKKCQHRLDWFHVARQIARIEKEFLYLRWQSALLCLPSPNRKTRSIHK
jgi:hypothetical protein